MPHCIIDVQQFENSDAAFVARIVALLATRTLLQFNELTQTGDVKACFLEKAGGNLFGLLTLLTVHSHKTLRQDAD